MTPINRKSVKQNTTNVLNEMVYKTLKIYYICKQGERCEG